MVVTVSSQASNGVNFIVTIPSDSGIYFYFTDALGTSRVITTETGTVCYDADSYPYGGQRTYVDDCIPPRQFTGYERDWETGIDYAGARFYRSTMARFMSPDPLTGDTSDPQSLNRYAYVGNNPINSIDPSGLSPISFTAGGWGFNFSISIGIGNDDCGGSGFPFGIFIGIGLGSNGHWAWDAGYQYWVNGPQPPTQYPPDAHGVGIGSGFLPGETAGVPNWVTGRADLSRWAIVNFSYNGSVNLPSINWHKIKVWVFALKKWPSYGSSSCGVYDSSNREGLGDICRFFGDSKISDSIRGCLQQFYNPDFYKGVGAYETLPGVYNPGSREHSGLGASARQTLFSSLIGLSAHAACLPAGLVLH